MRAVLDPGEKLCLGPCCKRVGISVLQRNPLERDVPIVTLGRTDTTLDLSSKEPRSDTDCNRRKHLFNLFHLDFEGKLSAQMNLDMFEKSSKYNPPPYYPVPPTMKNVI